MVGTETSLSIEEVMGWKTIENIRPGKIVEILGNQGAMEWDKRAKL